MKRLTENEKKATVRIFKHVNSLSNGYYGSKTEQKIEGFASENRWIMFPVYNVDSLEEGKIYPAPNVYLSFYDIISGERVISDNGYGQGDCWTGITFNNRNSMHWLDRVMKQRNQVLFINKINALGENWSVNIEHKIKTIHRLRTPYDEPQAKFKANTVTIRNIKDAITTSISNELTTDEYFNDEPVVGCSTICNIFKKTSVNKFDADIKVAFDLFIKILSLN